MLLTSEIPGIPHEDDKAERHGRDVLLLNLNSDLKQIHFLFDLENTWNMGGAERVVTQAPVVDTKLPDGKNLAQQSTLSA